MKEDYTLFTFIQGMKRIEMNRKIKYNLFFRNPMYVYMYIYQL